MKKFIIVILCLVLALFAFTSCNGDTKGPSTDNGNSENNGNGESTNTPETSGIAGNWISVDEDGLVQRLSFGDDGVVSYQSNSNKPSTKTYIMEGNLCYFTSDTDVIDKIDYTLDETAHTFTEISTKYVYTAEGETKGLIGTWIRKTSDSTYSYTITEKNLKYQCMKEDYLYNENNYTYTDNGYNTLELKHIDGKLIIGFYDEATDIFTAYWGTKFVREK